MTKVNYPVSAREERRKALPPPRWQLSLAIVAMSLGSSALAQTAPAINNSQPFFHPAPPAGFDPLRATGAELAAHGFPKRPSVPDQSYSTWAKVMANAKIRLANPVAYTTNRAHGPAQRAAHPAGGVGSATEFTSNWSGIGVIYPYAYFAANGSTVVGAFQPPSFGAENCSNGPYLTSIWVGFDGDRSNSTGNHDVLQAGVNAQACPTSYSAWYEWFTEGCSGSSPSHPCYETTVSNLTVNPGDEMYITVTYNTTSPKGAAFISNQTTGVYVSVSFDQPSGSSGSAYAGTSAEWVVERPTDLSDNSLYNLPNYYLPNTSTGYLWFYPDYLVNNSYYTPAGADPGSSVNTYYMVCDPSSWKPGSACPLVNGASQYISIPYYYGSGSNGIYGPWTVYFFPAGPAKGQ